jgi:hypothetical protein
MDMLLVLILIACVATLIMIAIQSAPQPQVLYVRLERRQTRCRISYVLLLITGIVALVLLSLR